MKKQKEKSGQTIEIKCTYDRLYQYSELTPTQAPPVVVLHFVQDRRSLAVSAVSEPHSVKKIG